MKQSLKNQILRSPLSSKVKNIALDTIDNDLDINLTMMMKDQTFHLD